MHHYFQYKTSLGIITIYAHGHAITMVKFGPLSKNVKTSCEETTTIKRAAKQLQEYLSGKRKKFELELALQGSPFQVATWRALQKIAYGETKSYGDIARALGNPNASRAVGGACNKNSIPIFIPCHRVIGSNGSLVGFSDGIATKKKLLEIERVHFHEARTSL